MNLNLHTGREVYYLAYAMDQEADNLDIDPIWTSSRTARQIHALGEVDKVCLKQVRDFVLNDPLSF